MNTFNRSVKENFRLNPDVVKWQAGKRYNVLVLQSNKAASRTTMVDGVSNATVPPQGLVALKIEGLVADVPLFRKLDDGTKTTAGDKAFFRDEGTAMGTVSGMLLNTFPQFSDAYIYTDATGKELKSVELKYRIGKGDWQSKTDSSYPFEFDVHLSNPQDEMEFQLKGLRHNNEEAQSKTYLLSNR